MKRLLTTLMLTLLLAATAWSQEARPRVGLTLGGGGAKGAAHIGVLKYIHELGIPIDYVTGTSMGSIIGGLTALGYTPEEMEMIIGGLDWSVYMSDAVGRDKMSQSDRRRHSTYLFSIPFNTSILDREIALPSGFVGGNNLLNLFNNLSIGYQDSISFDSLPIPFACVATNVTDGDAVVLRSGKFPTAIRASMAIPGVFEPVNVDGQLLMDGGMVNNFPVDICQEMGADFIIGIEVGEDLHDDLTTLQTLPQLATQLMHIVVKNKKAENRKLCDIYIRPDITGFNMLSFSREAIDTLINRGYREAQRYTTQLLALKSILEDYGPVEQHLQAPKSRNILNDIIILDSVITTPPVEEDEYRWLIRKGKLNVGSPILGQSVENAVSKFMGTGSYASINYRMSPTATDSTGIEHYKLQIDMRPADPHTFSLGLRYDSQESASILLNLGWNQNRPAGWKATLSARLGYNTRLSTRLTWAGRSLANFNFGYSYRRGRFDIMEDDLTRDLMRSYTHRFQFSISEFHLLNYSVSAGLMDEYIYYSQYPAKVDVNPAFYGKDMRRDLKNNAFGTFVRAGFDNMDDAYFATRGAKTNIGGQWLVNTHKDQHGYGALNATAKGYLTMKKGRRLTVIPQFYGRVLLGDTYHFSYRNLVGGDMGERYVAHQLPFIGTNLARMTNDVAAVGRVDVRYNIAKKHYLTLMANYLHEASTLQDFFTEESRGFWGVGGRYSISTPIGPVSAELHWSDLSRKLGVYFSLGYLF